VSTGDELRAAAPFERQTDLFLVCVIFFKEQSEVEKLFKKKDAIKIHILLAICLSFCLTWNPGGIVKVQIYS
jgi:hypothetical protein